MIDLGIVRPGTTIRIPFSSFDKDDGSSITMTNYAVADILVSKDGNTTAKADTTAFTATTDFSSKTGKHLCTINLAENTDAGFFAAGSEYLVAIDAVTIDTVTTGGWIAPFRIGYPAACSTPPSPRSRIGVTAGASAPESLIEALIERLRALGADRVRVLEGAEEHVVFPLPKGLGRMAGAEPVRSE